MLLPPTLSTWRFRATPTAPIDTPPLTGPVVRAALGAAFRIRACARGCGDGPCQDGPGCGWTEAFEPADNRARFRIDASDLDHRHLRPGDTWELRLVCHGDTRLVDAVDDMLIRGLGPARVPHPPLSRAQGVPPVDLRARAAELVGARRVEIVTPALFRRDGKPVFDASFSDVLRAIRLRGLAAGVEEIPEFEGEVGAVRHTGYVLEGHRWSSRQGAELPVRGFVGAWDVRVFPELAEVLALGELLGVGKGTALGLGVVRVG